MSARDGERARRGGGEDRALPWLAAPLRRTLATQPGARAPIHGPGGVGQFELALALAQAGCARPTTAPLVERPCGKLPELQAARGAVASRPAGARSGGAARIARLGPRRRRRRRGGEGGKKKPSKEIRVEAVRAAIGFATTTSARGRGKVVVVHPAERMNDVAANAFLKTLEEPPANARFLLCSAAPDGLLATIRSRCQQLVLPVPPAPDAEAWLAAARRRPAGGAARGERRPAAGGARPGRAGRRRRGLAGPAAPRRRRRRERAARLDAARGGRRAAEDLPRRRRRSRAAARRATSRASASSAAPISRRCCAGRASWRGSPPRSITRGASIWRSKASSDRVAKR